MSKLRVMPATARVSLPPRRMRWHPGVVPVPPDMLPWLPRRPRDFADVMAEPTPHRVILGGVGYAGILAVAVLERSILSAGAWRGGY